MVILIFTSQTKLPPTTSLSYAACVTPHQCPYWLFYIVPILTLVRSGYGQSAHAVPVLGLVAVRVLQHLAVTRPNDVTDGFALHYALETGGLAANYSYVF